MTIKRLLIPLFFLMGVALFSMIALQLTQALQVRDEAQRQISQVTVRAPVVALLDALYAERGATYLALMTDGPIDASLAEKTDGLIAQARSRLESSGLPSAPTGISTLNFLSHAVGIARAAWQEPAATTDKAEKASIWFDVMSLQIDRLGALRLQLLAGSHVVDQELAPNFQLRTYLLALLDHIESNEPLLAAELSNRPNVRQNILLEVDHNRTRSEVALELLDELLGSLNPALQGEVAQVMTSVRTDFRRREAELTGALRATGDASPVVIRRWEQASANARGDIATLQEHLGTFVRQRLDAHLRDATDGLFTWAIALLLTVLALGTVSFVLLERVIRPVELMRDRMLRLAEGNVDIDIPSSRGLAEINAMMDSLRVFRINAVRRARLQKERLTLHARLSETYRLMRDDLKAAALVQVSLLPDSRQHNGVRLASFFRPSNYLAGDTFDFVPSPGGSVIMFQIDVAGHGTAAALVSVVSHNAVRKAIEQWDGVSLAGLCAGINAAWPESLTYFTLLLVEIDPLAARGRMVQAGHPHPFLLTGDTLVRLGDGGLPIGVLPDADFDEVPFDFTSGTRFLALTDGVMDLETSEGEPFSEERLIEFLTAKRDMPTAALLAEIERALRDWHHQDTFKDDVTIVILEGDDKVAGTQA